MTHNDIYTKFMIEYDKANVTSSYPSLTKYEAATLLDRAYLALISRKLTGNNTRRAPFEYDTKAIEDLRPLLTTTEFRSNGKTYSEGNEYRFNIPNNLMYYIEGLATYPNDEQEIVIPVNHQIARKFRKSNSNIPWIKQPVSFMEGQTMYVLIDPFKHKSGFSFDGTYIKKPASFVESLEKIEDDNNSDNNNNNGGEDNGGGNSNDDDKESIIVSDPVFTPYDKKYTLFKDNVSVLINANQSDYIIYTINGGQESIYGGPITITEDSVITAYAVKEDENGNRFASNTISSRYRKEVWLDPEESTQEPLTPSTPEEPEQGSYMEYVDLGLPSGIKWSKWNVGASSENEEGDYLCWGDPTGELVTHGGYHGEYYVGTCPASLTDPRYRHLDIAYVRSGGECHTPTSAQMKELIDYCTFTYTTNYNGVTGLNGYIVKKKKSTSSNHIFLPCLGYREAILSVNDGINITYSPDNKTRCFYWSADVSGNANVYGWGCLYEFPLNNERHESISLGMPIRPVKDA